MEYLVGRFIFWILSVGVSFAMGAMLPAATRSMGRAAMAAFQNDQMSYEKFSHDLTGAHKRRH